MKKLMLVFAIAAACSFAGCNQDMDKVAQSMSKELGMPVEAMGQKKDLCAQQQVEVLAKEYQKLTKSAQDAFKAGLRAKYKKIILEGTQTTQTVTGRKVDLSQWVLQMCGTHGVECSYQVARKTLSDERKYEGTGPLTKVNSQGEVLTLSTQAASNVWQDVDYFVYNSAAFYGVKTLKDAEDLAQARAIDGPHPSSPDSPVTCSDPVALKDLR